MEFCLEAPRLSISTIIFSTAMPATVLIYISEAAQIAVVAVLSSTGPFWALETYLTTRKQFVPGTSVGPKASIW
jgi:hypothetical protein